MLRLFIYFLTHAHFFSNIFFCPLTRFLLFLHLATSELLRAHFALFNPAYLFSLHLTFARLRLHCIMCSRLTMLSLILAHKFTHIPRTSFSFVFIFRIAQHLVVCSHLLHISVNSGAWISPYNLLTSYILPMVLRLRL